jgi:hypothetical protein
MPILDGPRVDQLDTDGRQLGRFWRCLFCGVVLLHQRGIAYGASGQVPGFRRRSLTSATPR